MAVDYIPPTAVVEYAPGFGPFNLPDSGDWVALEADDATRAREFSMTRGRRDQYDTFDASTATFVLDNNDGELDEYESGSLVYGADGQAGTPIRFSLIDSVVSSTPVLIWTGFVTDGWAPGDPSERDRRVTVKAADWMWWAARKELPGSQLATLIQTEGPELWWRGRMTQPRITTSAGEIVDYSGSGTYPGSMLNGTAEMTDSLVSGDSDPAFRIHTGGQIESAISLPTGGTDFELVCVIQVKDLDGIGRDIAVGHTTTAAGNARWTVRIGSNGHIACRQHNGAGAVVADATITVAHNDGRPHLIRAGFTAGSLYAQSDMGVAIVGGSGSWVGPGGVLVTGNNTDARVLVDELAYFTAATTSLSDPATVLEGGDTTLWASDDITDRLDRLMTLSGVATWDPSWDPTFFTPVLVPYSAPVGGYVPASNLAAGIQACAGALGGGVFLARRSTGTGLDGGVQVFGELDIVNLNPLGIELSTEDPLPGGAFRFSGGARTGKLVDRVINEVRSASGAILSSDPTSIATYGTQAMTIPTYATGTDIVDHADRIIAARAEPTPETDDCTLTPWGDQDLTSAVVSDIEIGGISNVTLGADLNNAAAWNLADQYDAGSNNGPRICGESWNWTNGTGWTIQLTIA